MSINKAIEKLEEIKDGTPSTWVEEEIIKAINILKSIEKVTGEEAGDILSKNSKALYTIEMSYDGVAQEINQHFWGED